MQTKDKLIQNMLDHQTNGNMFDQDIPLSLTADSDLNNIAYRSLYRSLLQITPRKDETQNTNKR